MQRLSKFDSLLGHTQNIFSTWVERVVAFARVFREREREGER